MSLVVQESYIIHSHPNTKLELMFRSGQLIPIVSLLSPAQLDIARSQSQQSPSHLSVNRNEYLVPSVMVHHCQFYMHESLQERCPSLAVSPTLHMLLGH